MNNLWLRRATQSWMKDKVIRLAPKVPGSFDLYEVVRKILKKSLSSEFTLYGIRMTSSIASASLCVIIYGTKLPVKFYDVMSEGNLEEHENINLKFVKDIGMEVDFQATEIRAHEVLLQNTRARNSHLLQQPGPPDVKINSIQLKILLIILATAKLANWTMTAYRELDKPFTQAYKQILALPLKISTTLLYLPTSLVGITNLEGIGLLRRPFPDTKMANFSEMFSSGKGCICKR
jgi:hypothetical protein